MTEDLRKSIKEAAKQYADELYEVDYSAGTTPYSIGLDEGAHDGAQDGFLAGAEWRDQQFKEYLEGMIEPYIRTNASPQGTYQEGFDDGYTSAIDEIINELFKKEE